MRIKHHKSTVFFIVLTMLMVSNCIHAQDSSETKKWFIVLPLRWTHLQNDNTLLSGIKAGRSMNSRFNLSVSIYHSFYLKSFKSKADLAGFDEDPRLFINGMGGEIEYYLLKQNRINLGVQLLLGWGFMTYELKEYHFTGRQVNYFIAEPTLNLEYRLNSSSLIGLGIGYRPLLTSRQISYTSHISKGEIPIKRELPNGLNLTLTIKGLF